ncbi:HIT family protein [Hymenobacter sp. BT491]|uniref:HIT family protein n=1 Tax=Hymenobacter sp. BT491 TaxID=2766779 RepID=UPI001653AC66|nr:HIT family protein [Hymenobacter sp. BT491]MBC6992290.1 HIT family protein [Hymenobacter sp. BT491]
MAEPTVFQRISPAEYVLETQQFFVIWDRYPVSLGHALIISKQLRQDFFELTKDEQLALPQVIELVKSHIEKMYQPHGYNLGMNCGAAAGQTVFHFHCHVIPRYTGDMDDPSGGVRHCVAGSGYYNF